MSSCECTDRCCFRAVVRSFAIFFMLIAIGIATIFISNAGYWGAHCWAAMRAAKSIFGPDPFTKESMEGLLVLRAWATAGYPKKFEVIDIPEVGRYCGTIIYKWVDREGNEQKARSEFFIRWDYHNVAENPTPITLDTGEEVWDPPPQLEWYGDEPEEWYTE